MFVNETFDRKSQTQKTREREESAEHVLVTAMRQKWQNRDCQWLPRKLFTHVSLGSLQHRKGRWLLLLSHPFVRESRFSYTM